MNTPTRSANRPRGAHSAPPWQSQQSAHAGSGGEPESLTHTQDLTWSHDHAAQAGPDSPAWVGDVVQGEGLRVGLVSHDSVLRDMVAGICASAGAQLQISPVGGALAGVDVCLLDVQALTDGSGQRPEGGDVVLLGRAGDNGLWDAAALLGGCPVALLPEAESWLADRLAPRTATTAATPAVVVGVVGAVGGVGASTLACWLAADAAADGALSVLVDADPDSCGVDLLLGLESVEAMRWPDLCRARGVLRGEQLLPLLPQHPDQPGLHWLSWDRGTWLRQDAPLTHVLAALRTVAQAVVLDLGRARAGLESLAAQCDVVLVAMPRTVRGVLAAHQATNVLSSGCAEYVLCGVDVADVDETLVQEALGRTPLGHVRFDGRVPEAAESGRLLERGRKRHHQHTVAAVWDELSQSLTSGAFGRSGRVLTGVLGGDPR
ncbi:MULTISPECIES: septum site-determining protein Ssd [Kocuria]|uniref:Rv3660c-like CheY-like N-terminal domain-containing protein n=1 Tax=Kocuria subflava TaxID=1736139 RepID=A0A846U4F8_9MICC|nr:MULTISPECIES: septum site-determining protein Ssd [Kocuria]NKE08626.1 hypothetical protein [Kocuria subflava]